MKVQANGIDIHDTIEGTPVEMSRQIHAALPSAELAILRSASHLSNLEQPGEFTRVLSAFLDKAAGRTRL